MAKVTIVYWRDIPAQIIVGTGRRAAKVQLPERFEQAIDRAAMRSGAAGTDAYLAEWRRGEPVEMDHAGSDDQLAAEMSRQLDRQYDQARLRQLIENDGWA